MEMKFRRKWEGAHRFIENGSTVCSQPHGHTWNVEAVVTLPETFKMDLRSNVYAQFSTLKSKWHTWIDDHVDHSFMYNSKDPLLEFMLKDNPAGRHLVMMGDPTTEMVALCFKSKFQAFLDELNLGVTCSKITIEETKTNSISFDGNPHLHLPEGAQYWWNRADMSINDLGRSLENIFKTIDL